MDRYETLARAVEAEIEVKRSRFLARVVPVASEDAARAVVEEARKAHWDARHHCSAFVIGPPGTPDRVERSSDDGEPAGTAGMPMLEVLRGADLTDVVAVVTRWFGGTLLGTGGLVRAYSDAVASALDGAPRRERRLVRTFTLDLPHADAGRLENELRARGIAVTGTDYGAVATLHLAVPAADTDRLDPVVAELTAGRVTAVAAEEAWEDWRE